MVKDIFSASEVSKHDYTIVKCMLHLNFVPLRAAAMDSKTPTPPTHKKELFQ
jgi:hypothetical protein